MRTLGHVSRRRDRQTQSQSSRGVVRRARGCRAGARPPGAPRGPRVFALPGVAVSSGAAPSVG
eukprot:7169116-Prymnesium_polylepis.2